MSVDVASPRSRRALLTAALGAGVATVASAFGRPSPIDAADGGATVLGTHNEASFPTSVICDGASFSALYGFSTAVTGTGVGVRGETLSSGGAGVWGLSDGGTGVKGESASGVGVLASSDGTALRVSGKARFSRSGLASVPAGKNFADITVPGGLGGHSVVHATLQTYRRGTAVAAVRRNYPGAGRARIYLTKVPSSTAATPVGWFVAEY